MDIIWEVREGHHKLGPGDCVHCMKDFKGLIRWPQMYVQDCHLLELRLFGAQKSSAELEPMGFLSERRSIF